MASQPRKHQCSVCNKVFPTRGGLQSHKSLKASCRDAFEARNSMSVNQSKRKKQRLDISAPEDITESDPPLDWALEPTIEEQEYINMASKDLNANVEHESALTNQLPSTETPRIESDNVQPEDPLFRYPYPHAAGTSQGNGTRKFDQLRMLQQEKKMGTFGPFSDKEEWELAQWLMKSSVSQTSIDEYLRLPITRNRTSVSYPNKETLLAKIDSLPQGPKWTCPSFQVHGDKINNNAEQMVEDLDLWYRNPIECVEELLGNPEFESALHYAPEKHFADEAMTEEIINEMWTAEWRWETQNNLPTGATICPVILASDKTQLTMFSGDKQAWPVYLSIGNIAKKTRRQLNKRAILLFAYIPVTKLASLSSSARQGSSYRLFHYCMSIILEPMCRAGKEGINVVCADKQIRSVYPILAAYVADFPEQCLIAGVKENCCPICEVVPQDRGKPCHAKLRDPQKSLDILQAWKHNTYQAEFDELGLRPIPEPFWAKLPHANIFGSFTTDLLHQLHKGVFKDHLVKWCMEAAIGGTAEIDRRFQLMPKHRLIRHFPKGISHLSQTTGREHKEMQKVFAGLTWGAVPHDVCAVVRALLDFIYYALFQSHSSETLWRLQDALDTFHRHKDVFIQLGIRKHFQIPKFHMLEHYVMLIRSKGTADGFNTEQSERMHIPTKESYRASNKRESFPEQMVSRLNRREAIDRFNMFLRWNEAIPTHMADTTAANEDMHSFAGQRQGREETEDVELVSTNSKVTWRIAKRPQYPNIPVQDLITKHGAIDIIPALGTYLKNHVPQCHVTPTEYDEYNVYKHIVADIPLIQQLDDTTHRDIIHAIPTTISKDHKNAEPAYFDCVLIHDSSDAEDVGLKGYRAARVRAIFRLPPWYRCDYTLAYIEWFTPFTRPVMPLRFSEVSYSLRNGKRTGTVINVESIRQSIHLIPKLNQLSRNRSNAEGSTSWNTDNVMDKCSKFFLNSFLSIDTFQRNDGDYELVEEEE